MKHKILKVIGITLGCILAFIGVVVGVMAIMGKFKKQNIAPTQLTFLENNFEVKNDYSGSLHSFMLTGTSDKGEVNQNDCYIYFISRDDSGNIYGEELITLCNENGEPLVSDNQGRYSIKCNEPTYYYFKPLGSKPSHFDPDNPRANKGKVVLEATSGRVYSDRLTFYVDMAVENIRFEGASTTKTSVNKHGREYQSQTVSVSLGSAWPLTYHIEPYYSLNPMAKRDENKVVELYYHTNETSTDINDYQLICREYKNERVFNQDFLSTHKFIEEIDGNVCFVPDGSQSEFEFIYAVFESYNEQEAHPESDFIYASDRVEQYMAYAVLNVSVESETISNVAINNPNIQLNLYYENNFITLNGSVSDADVNSNDLGLTLNGNTTSMRFNEFAFGLRYWNNRLVEFESEGKKKVSFELGDDGNYNYDYVGGSLRKNNGDAENYDLFTITTSSEIQLDNLTLISSISLNGEIYKAVNGVAFLTNDTHRLTLLRTGSYLDFFTKQDSDYVQADFEQGRDYDFPTTPINSGKDKTFNILIKTPAENLELLALVVNGDGTIKYASTKVTISEIDLEKEFTRPDRTYSIDISYPNSKADYGEIPFEDIVNITGGSYTAGVLITRIEEGTSASVNILPNLQIQIADSTLALNGRYALVGYLDEEGNFVNSVRATRRSASASTTLYLLQLKNSYQQTAEELITSLINNADTEVINLTDVYCKHFVMLANAITINNNYTLTNKNSIEFDFHQSEAYEGENGDDKYCVLQGGVYHFLENTDKGHTLTVHSPAYDMLFNIFDKDAFKFFVYLYEADGNRSIYSSNVFELDTVDLDGVERQDLVVTFKVGEYVSLRSGQYFRFGLNFGNDEILSPAVVIDSSEASSITLNGIPLADSQDALNIPTIDVTINGVSGNQYSYSSMFNGSAIDLDIFSTSVEQSLFTPSPMYSYDEQSSQKSYDLAYYSLNEDVAKIDGTNLQIFKIGDCVIQVICGSTIRYIKVSITATGFTFQNKTEHDIFTTSTNLVNLKEVVSYQCNGEEITNSTFFTISPVNTTTYRYTKQGNGYEVSLTDGSVVAEITKTDGEWQISRRPNYSYTNITLNLNIQVKTSSDAINIRIYFTNSITADLNQDYNATVYAGTTILLVEKATNTAFTNNSLFRINDLETSNYYKITYTINGASEQTFKNDYFSTTDSSYRLLLEEGRYVFTILLKSNDGDDKRLAVYNINCRPNVVFSQTDEQKANARTLQSDNEYELSHIITINMFKTQGDEGSPFVYGLGRDSLYTENNYAETIDSIYENLSLTENENISLASSTIKTSWFSELDKVVSMDNIQLSASTTSFKFDEIRIENKYKDLLTLTREGDRFEANHYFPVGAQNNSPLSIVSEEEEWALTNVSGRIEGGQDLTFSMEGEKFTLDTQINEIFSTPNVVLTFTFSYSGKSLTYISSGNSNMSDMSITITPRSPAINIQPAYSNYSFNIIKDVFTIEDGQENYFKSISVEKVVETGTPALDSRVVGIRYIFEDKNEADAQIAIGSIYGEQKEILVDYRITYTDESYFVFEGVSIIITNCQSIEMQYPFEEYGTGTVRFSTTSNANEQDRDYFGSAISLPNYEPVSMGQTIRFDLDSTMSTQRTIITNRTEQDEPGAIANVVLVGTSNNMPNLVSISKDEKSFVITFSPAGDFVTAYLAFKIETTSSNYAYYFVRLYNTLRDRNLTSLNTNTVVNINPKSSSGLQFYSSGKVLGESLDLTKFCLPGTIAPTDENIYLYLLEASLLDGKDFYEQTGIKRYSLLNKTTLPALNNFATLKIGVVYNATSGSAEVFVGSIMAYVQPTTSYSFNSSLTHELEGIENGRYFMEWKDASFANPFTGLSLPELKIVKVNQGFSIDEAGKNIYFGEDKENPVITIASTTISRQKYVTSTLEFEVEYVFAGSDFVLVVHFIMPAITIPTDRIWRTVGNYSGTSGFVSSLDLTEFLSYSNLDGSSNKYAMTLKISSLQVNQVSQSDVSIEMSQEASPNQTVSFIEFVHTSGNLAINFEAKTYFYTVSFDMVFEDIASTNTVYRHVDISVQSFVDRTFPDSAPGHASELPFDATFTDTSYASTTASTITFNRTEDGAITTYSIGTLNNQLIIRTPREFNATLEFALQDDGDAKFVTTMDSNTISNGHLTIGFTHSAIEKVVQFNFTIKSNASTFTEEGGAAITIPFYVRVYRSYDNLVPLYLTKAAEKNGIPHENVQSNYKIDDLYSYLFTNLDGSLTGLTDAVSKNSVANTRRLALQVGERIIEDYGDLGFNDIANANYISFEHGDNNNISTSSGSIVLTFSPVSTTSNVLSTISFRNDAGASNQYVYQIMGERNGSKISDGLDVAEGDFVSTEEIATTQSLTYSFIINDKDEVNSFTLNKVLGNSEQTEFVIGSLLDKQNTAFYITSATASYTGPNVHEINLLSASSRFADTNGDLIYTLSFGLNSTEYQLIIKLKGNTSKDVAISFNRTANAKLFDSLAFSLALYGDGGKIADVNIGFYNLRITQTNQLEAYATTSVILDEYLSGNVKPNTVATASGIQSHISFQYDGSSSFYYYNGNSVSNLDADNKIYKYSVAQGSHSVTLYSIAGTDAIVHIFFNVVYDSKVIGHIELVITDRCAFNFFINKGNPATGAEIISELANSTNTYNYYMTGNPSSPFSHTITLFDDSKLNGTSYYTSTYQEGRSETYYNGLNIALYNKARNNNATFGITAFNIQICNSEGTAIESEDYSIEKSASKIELKFNKDFSGDIILKLIAGSDNGNGDYVRFITINVFGFVKFTYANKELKERNILEGAGGNGFSSGSTAYLVSTASVDGASTFNIGINASTTDSARFANVEILRETEMAGAQFAIVRYSYGMDVVQAFEAADKHTTNVTFAQSSGSNYMATVTLPDVEMSGSPRVYYAVIYKFKFRYMNQTSNEYYVTFKVYNNQSVQPANTNIDADEELSGTNLKLFQYTLTYTTNTNRYVVYCDISGNIKMDISPVSGGGVEATLNCTDTGTRFSNGSRTVELSSAQTDVVVLSDNGSQYPGTARATTSSSSGVVFRSDFSNISAFASFIKEFSSNSAQIRIGEKTLEQKSLISLDKGLFGVDLDNGYFSNEFNGKIEIISTSTSTAILSCDLRIFTTKALTPKGMFTLSSIFSGQKFDAEHDYEIIGVGTSPSTSWVNNASSTASSTRAYSFGSYEIYSAVWSGSGGTNPVYNLSATFYFIHQSGSVLTINYNTAAFDYFLVPYVEGLESSISTSNMVYKFSNSSNGTFVREGQSGTITVTNSGELAGSITNQGGQITISNQALISYKKSHPGEEYVEITCSIIAGGSTFNNIVVRFSLPQNV